MIYLDLPNISNSGTVEQQLAEIRSYIYRNNEQINATLSNLTVDRIWEQTASAISASNGDNEEKSDILSTYQTIRDLVIKTADVIINTEEQWNMSMNGSYLAKSQFGEYLRNTSVKINGNSTGFTQLYTNSEELLNYKSYQQNFIKEGLLDDSGAMPVYGIEVGLLTSKFDVIKEDKTTETVYVNSNKKLRITPEKLSLYDKDTEVAYIENDMIYFPNANITGGSINIGNGRFMVGEDGAVTLTNPGDPSNGKITMTDAQIASYYGDDNECEKIFSLSSNKISFYKLYTDNSSHEMANIQRLNYNDYSGLEIRLKTPLGSFFTITRDSNKENVGYAPIITYSTGNILQGYPENNIYPHEGLHINTSCYFNSSLFSNGYSTKTGKIKIKYINSNGIEDWCELIVRNGLITDLPTEDL